MTNDWLLVYVGQALIPILRPGDIVVPDGLAARKNAAARRAIEAVGGRLLFLQFYGPDLNPIENASSGSRPRYARPPPAPKTISGKPLPRPSTPSHPTDAPNYFGAAGYYVG